MNSVSHTNEVILKAFADGEPVFALDTGSDGADDILIGAEPEIWQDIQHSLDCQGADRDIPEHWTLEPITEQWFRDYFC